MFTLAPAVFMVDDSSLYMSSLPLELTAAAPKNKISESPDSAPGSGILLV